MSNWRICLKTFDYFGPSSRNLCWVLTLGKVNNVRKMYFRIGCRALWSISQWVKSFPVWLNTKAIERAHYITVNVIVNPSKVKTKPFCRIKKWYCRLKECSVNRNWKHLKSIVTQRRDKRLFERRKKKENLPKRLAALNETPVTLIIPMSWQFLCLQFCHDNDLVYSDETLSYEFNFTCQQFYIKTWTPRCAFLM